MVRPAQQVHAAQGKWVSEEGKERKEEEEEEEEKSVNPMGGGRAERGREVC